MNAIRIIRADLDDTRHRAAVLERQEKNRNAQALYESFGFIGGQYEPEAGTVRFRQKKL